MIPIENQVCNLELAKRLKELGVNQQSYHLWIERIPENTAKLFYKTEVLCFGVGLEEGAEIYSAFSVAELGEMMPETVIDSGREYYLRLRKGICWHSFYSDFFSQKSIVHFEEKNISNAVAKMLIYLIENGYVKAGEL